MQIIVPNMLFLPFMPSAIFRIPVCYTVLNYKGSRRHMALNIHIKSVKFEQTKPESTDSDTSYILQKEKKITAHCSLKYTVFC